MRKPATGILAALLFFIVPSSVLAATYYVDATGGNNSNAGTSEDQAWQTISKVTSTAFSAGDTILFKRGEIFTGNLQFSNETGAAGNPITVGAYGTGGDPILDSTGSGRTIDLRNSASYMTFEHLALRGSATGAIFLFTGTFDHLIFRNMDIASSTAFIPNTATTTNLLFEDVNIHDVTQGITGMAGFGDTFRNITVTGTTNNGLSYGSSAAPTSTGITIDNFTVTSPGGTGIVFRRLADSSISDVTVTNGSISGIAIDLGISNVSFDHVIATGNTQNGMVLNTGNNVAVTNATTTGSGIRGISMKGAGSTTVMHLYSADNGDAGMRWEGTSTAATLLLQDSVLEANGTNGLSLVGSGTATTTGTITRYNLNDGFNMSGSVRGIFDRDLADANGIDGIGANGDGYTWHDTSTGIVSNSVAKNNKKGGVTNVGSSNVDVYNNVFTHDTAGTLPLISLLDTTTSRVYNNTLYNPSGEGTGIKIGAATAASSTIANNIVYGFDTGINNGTVGGSFTEYHNIVFNTATEAFHGVTKSDTSLIIDPQFVAAASGDFHLVDGSPAVNAGTSALCPTTDKDGVSRSDGCDIGAYEGVYVAPAPAPVSNASNQGGGVISGPLAIGYHIPFIPTLVPDPTSSSASTASPFVFLRDLKLGMTSPDVLQLQKYLNDHGFTLAIEGFGSKGNETDFFGRFTYNALVKFQEAHAAEILAPAGLTSGSGYFGIYTRSFMRNAIGE